MTHALEAKGITCIYQEGTRALERLSLAVREGSFSALLASNGSGKTTLIKALSGLMPVAEGEVLVQGQPLKDIKQEKLYATVGVSFQNPDDQLFCPTVMEDVCFGPRNLQLPEEEVARRAEQALRTVNAWHLKDKAIHHLSFGEKKRAAIAGVLAMEPSILLLDEPTAGLDPRGEADMMALLGELNKSGRTVLMATHNIDMLPLFAHEVFVLNRGELLAAGPPAAVFCDHAVMERAGLRLPYISSLIHQMQKLDGLPVSDLPLTVGEARKRMLEFIPPERLTRMEETN